MPQSQNPDSKPDEVPEPHEVAAVAMELDKILSLIKTDKAAAKKHLIDRWEKMEK